TARRRQGLSQEAFDALPPDCPRGLASVLAKCLAPQPEDRWASGADLAQQLEFCRNRDVQELLHPTKTSCRANFRPWPLVWVFLAVGIPNGLAGILNFEFNFNLMKTNMPGAMPAFMRMVTIINLVSYPVGLGTLTLLATMVIRGAREMRHGEV